MCTLAPRVGGPPLLLPHTWHHCDGSTTRCSFVRPRLQLLGKTLTFTADLSAADCGCNAALYLVGLPIGKANKPGNCGGGTPAPSPSPQTL